jgi:RNA polymerase sigma-70 factor (ECF subfamily)
MSSEPIPAQDSEAWLERFHAGDKAIIAQLYADHAPTLARVVGGILTGADRESVLHDVFLQLIESPPMRAKFQGGSISAWLRQVARNRALDSFRRRSRRRVLDQEVVEQPDASDDTDSPEAAVEAAWVDKLVERFKRDVLPAKWHRVFDLCCVRQLSQREAAKVLGVTRTTLAYQELRVRQMLRQFMLDTDARFLDDA